MRPYEKRSLRYHEPCVNSNTGAGREDRTPNLWRHYCYQRSTVELCPLFSISAGGRRRDSVCPCGPTSFVHSSVCSPIKRERRENFTQLRPWPRSDADGHHLAVPGNVGLEDAAEADARKAKPVGEQNQGALARATKGDGESAWRQVAGGRLAGRMNELGGGGARREVGTNHHVVNQGVVRGDACLNRPGANASWTCPPV